MRRHHFEAVGGLQNLNLNLGNRKGVKKQIA